MVFASGNTFLFFLPDLNGGGAERALLNLLSVWKDCENRFSAILVVRKLSGPYVKYIPKEIRVIELGVPRSGLLSSLFSIFKLSLLIRQLKPVAVFSFLSHPSVVFGKILSRFDCKIVASIQNPVGIGGRDLSRGRLGSVVWAIKRSVISYAFKRTDFFLPISHGISKELIDNFDVDISKVMVLPNSVDVSNKVDDKDVPAVISDLREAGTLVLVTAGRLVRQKAYDVLFEALALLKNRKINFKLLVLGEGELRKDLLALVDRLDIKNYVDFLGFQDRPSSYFSNSDLFVLASRYEGFGNVIIEAMASGCPVVCTDAPYGPADILAGGKFGRLVPCERPDELATNIYELLINKEERDRYRNLGLERARDFDSRVVFAEFSKVLEMCAVNRL